MLLREILARATKLGYHTVIAGSSPNGACVGLHEGAGVQIRRQLPRSGFQVLAMAGRGVPSGVPARQGGARPVTRARLTLSRLNV